LTRRLFIESNFDVKAIPFFKREQCSSTEIRERMVQDKSWTTLLPKSVAGYIKQIQGVERLRDLMKTDRV
jgi:nicotinamide-nucleotide adenylyltransferase